MKFFAAFTEVPELAEFTNFSKYLFFILLFHVVLSSTPDIAQYLFVDRDKDRIHIIVPPTNDTEERATIWCSRDTRKLKCT